MDSKDLTILIIGFILSIIATVIFSFKIELNQISILYAIITIISIAILLVIWILYKRLRETENDIISLANEKDRLNEKLKIHEQLINIKADIKYLEREIIKNEKRK